MATKIFYVISKSNERDELSFRLFVKDNEHKRADIQARWDARKEKRALNAATAQASQADKGGRL